MKTLIAVLTLSLCCIAAKAQTNTPGAMSTNIAPSSILGMLQSYAIDNDQTYNGFESNKLSLWQGAVFSSVNGVPGASSIGNDMGLEIPIHKYHLHIESVTRFEQLFGDVHSQAIGIGYDYNLHQIQLSAGLDVEDSFANNAVRAVPFIEFKKASTTLFGLGTLFRYEFPIESKPGAGRVIVGAFIPL